MSANRKARIGDLIQLYSNPNNQNLDYPFYGINKDKMFMPTVANTEGLDASKYTILNKGMFVFSGMQTGRDVCIRIGLYENENPVLISPAYTTFIIKDENIILPEYFFLFFKRFEMDRYGWFLSDSSIRSNLDWERFCDIKVPLPSIEVQHKLVSVYTGLKSLAEENEALLQPLSDACQAFIVDCKQKYPMVKLGGYIEDYDQKNTDNKIKEVRSVSVYKDFRLTNAKVNKNELSGYKLVPPKHIAYVQTTKNEKCFAHALNNTDQTYVVSSVDKVFRSKDEYVLDIAFLSLFLRRKEFDRFAIFNSWGSAREVFSYSDLCEVEIPLPPIDVQQKVVDLYNCYEEAKSIAEQAREQLKNICPALVQKAAHIV